VAGVAPKDAGAASGVVNVTQQLGSSLGLGILVTVFAAASRAQVQHGAPLAMAHAVATALAGSTIFLGMALVVVLVVMRRPALRPSAPPVLEPVFGSPCSTERWPERSVAHDASMSYDERKCS
jgi:hypothetical protein